jgi:hypothetical protein
MGTRKSPSAETARARGMSARWLIIALAVGFLMMSCEKTPEGKVNIGQLQFVAESPTPTGQVLPSNGADYIVITPEMDAVLKADPVARFVTRVNHAATRDPEWNRDFRAAEYRALMNEYQKYVLELLKERGMIPTP